MAREQKVYVEDDYVGMVNRRKPFAWPYLEDIDRECVLSDIHAGEAYIGILGLLPAAHDHGVDQKTLDAAYDMLEDEDRETFGQFCHKK